MTEERDNIVLLVDDEGNEVEFEAIDSIELKGKNYVVLLPTQTDDEELEEEEAVILRVESTEDGEDFLVTIDDDEELDEVYEEFLSRFEDEEYEDDLFEDDEEE